MRTSPTVIPRNPEIAASMIKPKRSILKANPAEKFGIAKEPSPVTATTIMRMGLTMFASTAA